MGERGLRRRSVHTVCGSLNFQSVYDSIRFWFKVYLCTCNSMQSWICRPPAAKGFTTMKSSRQTVLASCPHSACDGWTVPPTHISQWLRILDIKMTCNYDVPKEHDLNKWTTHEVDHPPTRSTKFVCYRIQWINRESCISQHRCLGVCSMNWYISITVWEDGLPLASMDDQRQGHSLTAAALRWRGKREKATDKLHWFRYNW